MLIKYEEELWLDLKSKGIPGCIYAKYYLIQHTLIILEKTMYLAIILLLLVQYRFQNHWSDSNHNATVRTLN